MGTFKLPDLGEGLAEAEILVWHVKPGDHVLVDQPMVSVETAKAVVEVPVPFSGTVTALHGAVGDILATGSPLVDFDSGTVVGSMPMTCDEEFVDLGSVASRSASDAPRFRAVPVARALAKRLGLDLGAIDGSGSDGLIRLDDVARAAPWRTACPCPATRCRAARSAMTPTSMGGRIAATTWCGSYAP
jgi:pyruvate dehydrogenase E2 component (dihydrolipoamide acetyltransferase)